MNNYKFLVGLGAGLIMGISIANIQPLQADDGGADAQLKVLVNEVRQIKGSVKSMAGDSSSMVNAVKGMSADLKALNQRSNIAPKPDKNY